MHRFFIPPNLITPYRASFPPDTARQIHSVLRLNRGDEVTVLDNLGWEYALVLEQVSPAGVTGRVTSRQPAGGEPGLKVWLYQALTSRDKFEGILQKSAELGAVGVTPVVTERSLVRSGEGSKQERWQRILQEAAEQSGRGRIPLLTPALTLRDSLKEAATGSGFVLFCWEEENEFRLSDALGNSSLPQRISLFIGPEGGFSQAEAQWAREAGANIVSLGGRILRTETAALAALALVMHRAGELG